MRVIIYIEVIYEGRAEVGEGRYAVLLEYIGRNGQPITRELQGHRRNTTKNRTFLYACIEGLKRLNKPCEVTIRLNCPYVAESVMQERLAIWEEYGWIRQGRQEPVRNADLWKEFQKQADQHLIEVIQEKHSGYTNILRFNLLRAELTPEEDRRDDGA